MCFAYGFDYRQSYWSKRSFAEVLDILYWKTHVSYLEEEWKERNQGESEEICSRFDNLRFIKNSIIENYLVFNEIGNKEARAAM